jgi:Outer membrane protein beta-barrel domain
LDLTKEDFVRKFIWAVVALAGISAAHAGDLSYSYAEGGIGRVDLDQIDAGDSYFIGGSLGFGTSWLGFVEYSTSKFDEAGMDADLDQAMVGFGGHFAMADNIDFVGKLAYVDQSVDVNTPLGNGSADENGYMLSAGVRGRMLERLDLSGAVEYVDVGDGDDTGLSLRGLYDFTDMFSLGARLGYSDDATSYGVFARFTF